MTVSDGPSTAACADKADTTTTAELHEYIQSGPLLRTCGLSPSSADLEEWLAVGKQLAEQLHFDPDSLTDTQRLRIYHYYLPIFFWCRGQLEAHKASGSTQALVLGISAPQGCGKTTVVEQLEQLFRWSGRSAASVSIDDFYLTYEDQSALAASNPSNKLLQYRGNAGSHDLTLGAQTLQQLRSMTTPGETMQVPRYDKSAYSGRGDRADKSTWPAVTGPLDVILFEGWMLGFAALPAEQLSGPEHASLADVNERLRAYAGAWDSLVDSWLVIRIGDPQWVFRWRLQAEEAMRATGKPGMTDDQLADFVSRYMPAYAAYLPGLYAKGPTTCKPKHTLIIEVDQNRSPLAQQPDLVV